MSIDAKIRDIEITPEGLLLHLEPRRYTSGWSLTGQKTLLIEQPTWTPAFGMAIWGGDSAIIIETDGSMRRQYRRQGYTKLRENFGSNVCRN